MNLRPGMRVACPACSTELITVKAGRGEAQLACGGLPLTDIASARLDAGHRTAAEGAQLGKRYIAESLGVELLCTKGGTGELTCNGAPMALQGARALPASD